MAVAYNPYVKTYNARNCIVTITTPSETINVTGFGEDMINISKDEALAENVVGAMGDVARSEINNGIYTVSLTVQSVSPSCKKLLALKDSSELFGISVTTPLGINFNGTKAQFLEIPELSVGSTAEDVEFSICVYDGVYSQAD